jgi:hypothetical protein
MRYKVNKCNRVRDWYTVILLYGMILFMMMAVYWFLRWYTK